MLHKKTVWLGIALFTSLILSTLLFSSPLLAAGTGPADALLITGAPNVTAPKSFTWFKFDETGQNKTVEAYLETSTPAGVLFRVYTPESIGSWLAQRGLHPVGVSAVSPEHNLVWEGRFQQAGTYYIVVQNTTEYPVEYVLTVQGDGVTTAANTVRPTPTLLPNPLATPIPQGNLSGGKIVFQESSGGNIYTVNADGSNLQRLTFGLDPAWSPDGTQIAFVRQGPVPGLWLINADGTGEVNLFGGTQVRSPAWASNDEIIYSTINRVIAGAPTCFLGVCFGGDDITRWTMFKYDLRDESITNVKSPPTGAQSPTVNRVLGKIAFLNPGLGLMLTDLDNNGPLSIIDDDQSIKTPYMSPDGSRLTYMVSQPPAYQIAVAVWDGTNPTLLTHNDPLSTSYSSSVAPTFSPDSQEILYLSNRNGKWEFFAINADGTNERQVLKNVTDEINLQYDYSGARVVNWVQ